jgi:hypothetical protein
MAEDEAAVRKSEGDGTAFLPLNRCPLRLREGTGDGQHGRVSIKGHDTPSRSDDGGHMPGHDTGAAGHIQDAPTGLRRGVLEEYVRPRTENRGNAVLLTLRTRAGEPGARRSRGRDAGGRSG